MNHRWRSISFHLTQIVTGHGCFGAYLHRIGKAKTPAYFVCGADEDTPEHTVEECRWAEPRRELMREIGRDISLPAIIRAAVESRTLWTAVATFARVVMLSKEQIERELQGRRNLDP